MKIMEKRESRAWGWIPSAGLPAKPGGPLGPIYPLWALGRPGRVWVRWLFPVWIALYLSTSPFCTSPLLTFALHLSALHLSFLDHLLGPFIRLFALDSLPAFNPFFIYLIWFILLISRFPWGHSVAQFFSALSLNFASIFGPRFLAPFFNFYAILAPFWGPFSFLFHDFSITF